MDKNDFIRECENLASSPAVAQVLDQMEASYTESWKAERDPNHREHLWRMVATVALFRNELRSVAQNGRVLAFNKRFAPQTRQDIF